MNPNYYIEFFYLKFLLQLNFLILIFLFIFSGIYYFFSKYRNQKIKKITGIIERIFIEALKHHPPLQPSLIPKKYLKVFYLLPILEQFEDRLKGGFWEEFKTYVVRNLLFSDIRKKLVSAGWQDRGAATRILIMSPDSSLEKYVEVLLKDAVPLVRFNAAICALKIKSENLVNKVLEALSREEELKKYPYRDALINSDHFVYQTITKRYREDEKETIRIAALQVLSLSFGYLTIDDVLQDLESDNYKLRWWAVRALENMPSPRALECLSKAADDPQWHIQAIAVRIMGKLHDKKAIEVLKKKIQDSSSSWVRINAALSLKEIGTEGIASLKNVRADENKEAYEVAQYALNLTGFYLEEWKNKWPEIE